MSPVPVTLQVPYTENEQQFLLQAVATAVRTFRSLNRKPADGFGKVPLPARPGDEGEDDASRTEK
jgi:hypothetical protein